MMERKERKKRKKVWRLPGLCLLLALAFGCGKRDEAAEAVERGMEAFAGGDFAGAKEILSKAGEDAGALRALGIVSYEAGEFSEAAAYFDRALALLGEEGEQGLREDILRYQGDALMQQGDSGEGDTPAYFAEAASAYGRLIALDNEQAEYYLLRGRALLKLGDTEGAVSDFRTAVSASEENPEYCEDIYLTLREQGAAGAGAEFLEVICRKGPEDADKGRYGRACLELALSRMEGGQYEEALSLIQEALPLAEEPVRKELLYAEGACYERLLDFETALERFLAYREAYGSNETVDHEIAFLMTRTELPGSDALEGTDASIQVETGPADTSSGADTDPEEADAGPETAADEGL